MLSVEDIQQKIMPICLEYGIKKAYSKCGVIPLALAMGI